MRNPMTVGEMIARLQEMASESRLGMSTVVMLCEAEREYIEFHDVKLEQDNDGALVLLKVQGEQKVRMMEVSS